MNDFYTEQLVKKGKSTKDSLIKLVLILAAVASVIFVFFVPMAMLATAVIILIVILVFKSLDVEYEYLYVNGDLDIDKIMSKSRRKRIFSTHINDVELLAPAESAEARHYQRAKLLDFSSGNLSARRYILVTKNKGVLIRVLFEPNDTIIEGMFLLAPRKVVRK